jgi:hypothetical protein
MTPACPKCEPNDGSWQTLPNGALARCNCPRGLALVALDAQRAKAAKEKLGKAAKKRTKRIEAARERGRRMRAAGAKLEKKYRELPLVDEASNRYGRDE